jgi:hypothetical protein
MKRIGNAASWLSVITMLAGAAISSPAATTGKADDQSRSAARLLRDIRADSVHIRAAAARLYTLTESSSSKWLDYDRQWNAIKPSVEDMQMKLARLETMQASISPALSKDLDQSKMLIQEIQSRTRQLRALLDTPGVQPNDVKFKVYSRGLRSEAARLITTVTAS